MPFETDIERLDARTVRHRLQVDGAPIGFRAFLTALRDDGAARAALTEALAACPFRAFFWETPPVTDATRDRAFEFVLVDSPALARVTADPAPFAAKFDGAAPIAVFDSLGGDATLIAPRPEAELSAYPHLAAFVRQAPAGQVDALWRTVGEAALDAIGPGPIWLSTSGLGVSWLHVRIDSRPKYYTHAPYRAA